MEYDKHNSLFPLSLLFFCLSLFFLSSFVRDDFRCTCSAALLDNKTVCISFAMLCDDDASSKLTSITATAKKYGIQFNDDDDDNEQTMTNDNYVNMNKKKLQIIRRQLYARRPEVATRRIQTPIGNRQWRTSQVGSGSGVQTTACAQSD